MLLPDEFAREAGDAVGCCGSVEVLLLVEPAGV